ncbi:hypothetical protein A5787_17200 [Mycobacterium sp. 852002-50816_SCH5313054-b]|uniref:hypothetical protein n=1 Tax=Mycobacterium sp. 852002-50816_SCH5313054-b TaxID=1834092 RepID=UPI0007FB9587|nr:hypothetical protein [Mycobacterium sp. 852002-50816_SCH5313054-b]OBF62091.1 hypothetical protein A5787_17200 [Mycobacterium sp. 852002-50816_SCH5313054-b]
MLFVPTRITAIIEAGLLGAAILTGIPAHGDVTVQPALSHSHPLQPPPAPPADPKAEVQELLRQITELDDTWDSLTPPQRNQRIAGLQQQVTVVDRETRNLPPDQQPEIEGMLGMAIIRLLDLTRKAQGPNQPCYFPLCLPGL